MNKLVLGNLFHRPIRVAISVLAVAIEVIMILSITGVFIGQVSGSRASTLGVGADMVIQPPNASFLTAVGGAPVPAKIADVVRNELGERRDGRAHVVLRRADRRRRTRDQRALRREQLLGRLGLVVDGGLIAGIAEHGRRENPAGVAVDAGGVDEEVAGDVVGELESSLRHANANEQPARHNPPCQCERSAAAGRLLREHVEMTAHPRYVLSRNV